MSKNLDAWSKNQIAWRTNRRLPYSYSVHRYDTRRVLSIKRVDLLQWPVAFQLNLPCRNWNNFPLDLVIARRQDWLTRQLWILLLLIIYDSVTSFLKLWLNSIQSSSVGFYNEISGRREKTLQSKKWRFLILIIPFYIGKNIFVKSR